MRFWQKIYIGTLILFVIAFDIGAYGLVSYSYDFLLQRETDSAFREHAIILSSAESNLETAEKLYPDAGYDKERLTAIIKPLADYYELQGIYLALFLEDKEVFSNIEFVEENLLTLASIENTNMMQQKQGDARYLYVASQMPNHAQIKFLYARDITALDGYKKDIGQVFVYISTAVCLVLGVCIFILLKYLTIPIERINQTANAIAKGAYDKRVPINSKDELGEMGASFNLMANSIEENVSILVTSAQDKQQFIDNLTHEMRTPLTSILGFAEYLQNAKAAEEDRIKAALHL